MPMRSLIALALCLIPLALAGRPHVAEAQQGVVVYSGAATDDRWQKLLDRNDLPETPGTDFYTRESTSEEFVEDLREALVLAGSPEAAAARISCEGEPQSLLDHLLTAREELDFQEWASATDHLEKAKATWHCAGVPAPLSELSEVYFLQGLSLWRAGRTFGANPYFAVAFGTGFEPPDLAAQPPEVREAYYNTAIDPTLVPKVPLTVDKAALDGFKVWIDGKESAELFEVPVGEHLVQLTTGSGRLVASALIFVDPERGGGLTLPGAVFPVESRLDVIRTLDKALVEGSLTFTYQDALARMVTGGDLGWLVVVAVDSAAGDLAGWTVSSGGQGSAQRVHLRGSGLGEVGRFVYPAVGGALILGAAGGAGGYALAYQHLTTRLYPSQDAVEANQTRGYVALGIGSACAAGAVVTGILWGLDRRRRKHELIYGGRIRLGVEPGAEATLLTLSGSF